MFCIDFDKIYLSLAIAKLRLSELVGFMNENNENFDLDKEAKSETTSGDSFILTEMVVYLYQTITRLDEYLIGTAMLTLALT